MSDHERVDAEATPAGAAGRPFLLTATELWALLAAALSAAMLHGSGTVAAAVGADFTRHPGAGAWLLIPHVILIALLISGLRPLSALLQAFIFMFACLVGLDAWVRSGGRFGPGGPVGFFVALQVALLALCLRISKRRMRLSELPALGPRIALGGLVGAVGWLGASAATATATAQQRATKEAFAAVKRQEYARRDAYHWAQAIVTCMQRVPVTPDSQPIFPVALNELAAEGCPQASMPTPTGFATEYEAGAVDSTGNHRTFALRLKETPWSDTSRAYEIDSSMVVREWNGGEFAPAVDMAGHAALDKLVEVARCVEGARTAADGSTTYPESLTLTVRDQCGLRPTADPASVKVRLNGGYALVSYHPPAVPRRRGRAGGYTLLIEAPRDSLGRGAEGSPSTFLIDSAGMIHTTRRGRAATAADPIIPDCPARSPATAAPCRRYLPRQRWGAETAMPMITGWSRSGNGTLGTGEMLFLIPSYQPLLESDRAVEASVQWEAGSPVVPVPRHNGTVGEAFSSATVFRLQHAYADTGVKQIEFRLRAADGEEYAMHDSVHVVAPTARPR